MSISDGVFRNSDGALFFIDDDLLIYIFHPAYPEIIEKIKTETGIDFSDASKYPLMSDADFQDAEENYYPVYPGEDDETDDYIISLMYYSPYYKESSSFPTKKVIIAGLGIAGITYYLSKKKGKKKSKNAKNLLV